MQSFTLFDETIRFGPDIQLRKKANELLYKAKLRLIEDRNNLVENNDIGNPDVAYNLLRNTFYQMDWKVPRWYPKICERN